MMASEGKFPQADIQEFLNMKMKGLMAGDLA